MIDNRLMTRHFTFLAALLALFILGSCNELKVSFLEEKLSSGGQENNSTLTVIDLSASAGAFAAIRSDHSVRVWGSDFYGGDASAVDFGPGVGQIYSTIGGFVARRLDDQLVTWGFCGDFPAGAEPSGGIQSFFIHLLGVCLLHLDDDSLIVWGDYPGADVSGVDLSGGIQFFRSSRNLSGGPAFVALKNDGSVVSWGDPDYGGDTSGVDFSAGVQDIFAAGGGAFTAILNDGSVVAWGDTTNWGDVSTVDLSAGVQEVFTNDWAYAALLNDGTVQTWGHNTFGGNSVGVDFSGTTIQVVQNSGGPLPF